MDLQNNILNVQTCTDTDFRDLYHQGKKIVWLMKIDREYYDETHITGFALDKEYIICPHHSLPQIDEILNIEARPLTEDNFKYRVEEIFEMPSWDIAWLKIVKADGCSFGELPSDCSLSVGQVLVHIDGSNSINSNGHAGLFSVGRVAFKCLDKVDLPEEFRHCEEYIFSYPGCCENYKFNYRGCVPKYRIMGHVCNSFTISEASERQTFSNKVARLVHSQVPLIQISGLCFRGISGSPVFNVKGEVVGMMVFGGTDGFSFAIHASLLKQALKELDIHKTKKDQIMSPNFQGGDYKYKAHILNNVNSAEV